MHQTDDANYVQPRLLPDAGVSARGYHLFHDEAGFVAGSRFGVHGLLAIEDSFISPLVSELRRIRSEERYFHEIHFKQLGGTRVEGSANWRVANRWLRLAFEHALGKLRFKAFAVDMQHEDFDVDRYPNPTAAYRRFSITVAKSLIAWSLRGEGRVELSPFTDAGNSSALKLRRDGDLFDKFHVYVAHECRRAREERAKSFYPDVLFRHGLRGIPSNPSKLSPTLADSLECTPEALAEFCELIQFVDLLCGCVYAALELRATSVGKLRLAETFADFMAEKFEIPWHRARNERRRMSVSLFPGPGRTPYAISLNGVRAAGLVRIKSDPDLLERYTRRFGYHPDLVASPNQHGLSPILVGA